MKTSRLLLFLIGFLILSSIVFFYSIRNTKPNATIPYGTVTGRLNINGVVPENATISIFQREANNPNKQFELFARNILPEDRLPWTFNYAIAGRNYEIQGVLLIKDKIVAHSVPVTVTAPADIILIFHIPQENKNLINAPLATRSGINGYMPTESSISLEYRILGSSKFVAINSDILTNNGQTIRSTKPGTTYEIRSVLRNKANELLYSSNIAQITSPLVKFRENETLLITSLYIPEDLLPETKTPIMGSIRMFGIPDPNTKFTILQRQKGENKFEIAADNIPAFGGTTWKWDNAKPGIIYELKAVYKKQQKDNSYKDIAYSSTISRVAPTNDVLTIYTGYTYAPSEDILSFICPQGNSSLETSILLPVIPDANSYWLQIGTTNGGKEIFNKNISAVTDSQPQIDIKLKKNIMYYGRFAYTSKEYTNDISDFSPFGKTTLIKCID